MKPGDIVAVYPKVEDGWWTGWPNSPVWSKWREGDVVGMVEEITNEDRSVYVRFPIDRNRVSFRAIDLRVVQA